MLVKISWSWTRGVVGRFLSQSPTQVIQKTKTPDQNLPHVNYFILRHPAGRDSGSPDSGIPLLEIEEHLLFKRDSLAIRDFFNNTAGNIRNKQSTLSKFFKKRRSDDPVFPSVRGQPLFTWRLSSEFDIIKRITVLITSHLNAVLNITLYHLIKNTIWR